MQIEDGGDSPEVNRLLLEALRAGVRHQVSEKRVSWPKTPIRSRNHCLR